MSLRKKPTITAKRIAASQTNGRRSRGPATREGRERIRDANTRHGFYSQAEGVALRASGEKPEEFDAVVKARTGPSPYERRNRAHPPQRPAHAANAGFQISGDSAAHQGAAEH